jgi:Domain of unknown function (DUF1998).
VGGLKMEIGELSQNQIITTFGPGSIIDAKLDSVVSLDINYWNRGGQEYYGRRIYFNKLASYLGVRYFMEPKQGKDSVPVTIFPDWHVCSNGKCNLLFKLSEEKTSNREIYDVKGPICPDCNSKAYPSRFIVMCDNGHIDDFPYREYLHGGKTSCTGKLRLISTSYTSSLNSLQIKCDNEKCKAIKKMGDAMQKETFKGFNCKGKHVHKPKAPFEACNSEVIPSLRGATNVYFSIVRSALEIPPWSDPLFQLVEEKVVNIQNYIEEEQKTCEANEEEFDYEKTIKRALNKSFREINIEGFTFEKFKDIYDKVVEGISEYSEIKESEYRSILNHHTLPKNQNSSFLATDEEIPSYFKKYFSRIIRIEKVREVTALKGFARGVYPDPENDNFGSIVNLAGKEMGWLPAIRTNGEGVFLELNKGEIKEWLGRFDSDKISKVYDTEYRIFTEKKGWEYKNSRNVVYVLLHTLAHILIRELALSCGYSTTELKERIYFSKDMCGILIYTGSGDSEGTLGGLEEMGKSDNFKSILLEALKNALVCSGDPSCLTTYPGNGELNGAACHACSMIPETACENGNRLLDRRTVVPTEVKSIKGYFEELVTNLCGITI